MDRTVMKKPIKIIEENRPKIDEAFDDANGRADANTLTGSAAYSIAKDAETELEDRGLPVSRRAGAKATYTPAGPPLSYKYSMTTTTFEIERNSSGWRLTNVEKTKVYPRSAGGMTLTITREQADIVMQKALKGLRIAAPEAGEEPSETADA
jgi:hypothetical protein